MADQQAPLLAMSILMPIIAIVAVALRFYARKLRKHPILTDDWLITVAALLVTALGINGIIQVIAGNKGKHSASSEYPDGVIITSDQQMLISLTDWLLTWIDHLAIGITKASVLLFYRRIFLGRVFYITSWVVFILNAMFTIAYTIGNIFECTPISASWTDQRLPQVKAKLGVCVDVQPFWQSGFIIDIILDILVLMLPWYPVWKLQSSMKHRLEILGMLLLGAFVVVGASVRYYFLGVAFGTNDPNYGQAPLAYWTMVEAGVGVLSACLPMYRPLLDSNGPGTLLRGLRDTVLKWAILSPEQRQQTRTEHVRADARADDYHDAPREALRTERHQLPSYMIQVNTAFQDTATMREGV